MHLRITCLPGMSPLRVTYISACTCKRMYIPTHSPTQYPHPAYTYIPPSPILTYILTYKVHTTSPHPCLTSLPLPIYYPAVATSPPYKGTFLIRARGFPTLPRLTYSVQPTYLVDSARIEVG